MQEPGPDICNLAVGFCGKQVCISIFLCKFTPQTKMKRTKRIFQWLVGIGVGFYLALVLLPNVPFVQRWLASGVASVLEEVLDTRVELGRVKLGWNGHIVVDDLHVWDQQQEEMLHVARVAARLAIGDLLNQRIRIGNAQLFGMHANLYQQCEDCPPNFKFFIDAFASKDTTRHTPLDLRISQLLVRRGNIKWEQRWRSDSTKFSPSRLDVRDLNLTAHLNVLTDDSLNLRVKRLDFEEEYSGLALKSLSFAAEGNKKHGQLSDLALALPHSSFDIPSLKVGRTDGASKFYDKYEGTLKAHIAPQDFLFLLPQLAELKDEANLHMEFQGQGDRITLPSLYLQDNEGQLQLALSAWADHLRQGRDSLRAGIDIRRLYADQALLRPYLQHKLIDRIGTLHAQGQVQWARQTASGHLDLQTPLGTVAVKGHGSTDGNIDANVQSKGFQLGELLEQNNLGLVALDMQARGTVGKRPDLNLKGCIAEMDFKGHRYRNIDIDGHVEGKKYRGQVDIGDPYLALSGQGSIDLENNTYGLHADITDFAPHLLNLTQRYPGTHFAGEVVADLQGRQMDDLSGILHLNNFSMTDSTGVYRPGDIHLTAHPDDEGQHLLLISPFLEAQMVGNIAPKEIANQVKRMVSRYLPTEGREWKAGETFGEGEREKGEVLYRPASFSLRAYNAEPLRRLLGLPLELTGTLTANGEIDSEKNALWMKLRAPGLEYGKEHLRNINVHLESNFEELLAMAQMQRQMKGRWIDLGLDTQGHDDRLTTRLFFDNKVEGEETPPTNYEGNISIISRLWRDAQGLQGFEGEILPSNFVISDTLWTVHPGFVSYHNGTLQVDSLRVSQGNRFISVDGRASREEGDTLHAQLQRINLEYIFSLVNFHAVELTGEATGHAYAHSLFAQPKADAYIRIPQFALNYGTMGDLDIHLNWGQRPYSIFLDGRIEDATVQGETFVQGYITPKKDVDYHGIDLNVKTERVNLEFINKWTNAIFDDLQGRATGWVHIFGPFKQINIEGDALVNEGSVGIPFIGVRYHLENDSVQLRPDNIYFTGARLYDPQGTPTSTGHYATVDGHLHHESFKNLTYDINIQGQNIQGYNFTDFGDQNFYGTVYATGNVRLQGSPGNVRIDIKARPERGTTFTYNATSPDKLTDTPFISYRPRSEHGTAKPLSTSIETEDLAETAQSDLRINFDLDIDQQSTMNLLMDVRSGDKITLNGSGHMLAHYYNKGSFDLFGTYRVDRGTYNLSLQEVIRKNFEFSPNGSITFKGEPYDADLDLQAVHTVSGVSLNDINPKANFSNTSTRVNCLMNIGGKARAPRITFDFDIPTANEEEKQMVRSLISTEEERNMQVIYLLGIGRFYAYDYTNPDQNQGTTAMNSLLSSTLSGTINQALSSIIGSHNWNVGANLRTGQDGWNDMDVEGMLQGNLLNNRLIINGNFGYRDNPMATTNFIGDFDVKYLLTRSGSVALKAYSETNDRYFTKSSLTTQGIGVLLKKDFTSWRDLFTKRKRKAKK